MKWYAIQETRHDTLEYGSYSFERALEMLKDQGYGLIAVIVNGNHCIKVIMYEEVYG